MAGWWVRIPVKILLPLRIFIIWGEKCQFGVIWFEYGMGIHRKIRLRGATCRNMCRQWPNILMVSGLIIYTELNWMWRSGWSNKQEKLSLRSLFLLNFSPVLKEKKPYLYELQESIVLCSRSVTVSAEANLLVYSTKLWARRENIPAQLAHTLNVLEAIE